MTDVNVQSKGGTVAGIIACVLAVLGILFLGILFVPLASIVAPTGTIFALKSRNMGGIGINVLAWVLTLVGLMTSPVLLMAIGIGASA